MAACGEINEPSCYNFKMGSELPNAEQAIIDPRKLRDYALNPKHDTGRFKAAFFAQMGYSGEDWQQLEKDIRHQHLTQPAEMGKATPFGQKYTITAPLRGPNGALRWVTTAWIIRKSQDRAEMITIEPASRVKGN
jgi:hypothetical protein